MTVVQPWLPPQHRAAPNIPPPPQQGQPNPNTGFDPDQPRFPQPMTPVPLRRNRVVKWCFFLSLLATVACAAAIIVSLGGMISEPFTVFTVEPVGARSYIEINSSTTLTSASVPQGPCALLSVTEGNFVFECPGFVDVDDPITVGYTTVDGSAHVATSNWGRGLANLVPFVIGMFGGGIAAIATLVFGLIWLARRKPTPTPQPLYASQYQAYPPGYYR